MNEQMGPLFTEKALLCDTGIQGVLFLWPSWKHGKEGSQPKKAMRDEGGHLSLHSLVLEWL